MTTRLVNEVPMTFKLVPPHLGHKNSEPFWVSHLAQPIPESTRDIGYGFSPFDAYIDFVGKMGAC